MSEAVESRTASGRWSLEWGATRLAGGGVRFRVWAPCAERLAVKVLGPRSALVPLVAAPDGVFEGELADAGPEVDYLFVIDGSREIPDPVSRWQPRGVHGPSRLVDPDAFPWTDAGWEGIPLERLVIYELHVGTFTAEGTFEAAIGRLPALRELGVTGVELMPVAEFPGGRNWGYDGVYPYAPQSSYGGPLGLKRLVDACHREGLAVILDVVYNHLGPEGNYLPVYGPYFTDGYRTPWGSAINFDGPDSDHVRRYFIENALYWQTEYRVDGLRLDAVHGIFDFGARHILHEIADEVHQNADALGRTTWVIAESDLNDVRLLEPPERGGYGLDAQWCDDFHHALHAVVVGTREGYFADFGRVADVAKAIREGFVIDGRHSRYRRRRHGSSSATQPAHRFVAFCQNHDQVANPYQGQRLNELASLEHLKLAAMIVLCGPNLPLLFMGQEYGESAPFHYFTSHGDPQVAEAVRQGRHREFAFVDRSRFPWADPQDAGTFDRCRLDWELRRRSPHREVLAFHRELLELRRSHPALARPTKEGLHVESAEDPPRLVVRREGPEGAAALLACNLSGGRRAVRVGVRHGGWQLAVWSGDTRFGGPLDREPPVPILEPCGDPFPAIELEGWSAALYLKP